MSHDPFDFEFGRGSIIPTSPPDDDPTSVQQVLKDFQMSRRQSVIGTAKRKVSPGVMQRLDFNQTRNEDSPLFSSTRKVPLAKAPRLSPMLGPDPLQGSAAVAAARVHRLAPPPVSEEQQRLRKELDDTRARLREREGDAIASKAEVTKWEALHARMEAARARERAERDRQVERWRLEKQRLEEDNEVLKFRLAERQDEQQEARRDSHRILEERREQRNNREEENAELVQENMRLAEEVAQTRIDSDRAIKEAEESMEQLKFKVRDLESRLEEVQVLEQLQSRAGSKVAELTGHLEAAQLEVQIAKQEADQLRAELKLNEEAVIQRRAMSEELARYPKLVKEVDALKRENKLLNDTAENVQLLRERVASMESELQRTRVAAEQGARAASDLVFARARLSKWEAAFVRLLETDEKAALEGKAVGVEVLEQKWAQMQRKQLVLTQECEELKLSAGKVQKERESIVNVKEASEERIATLRKDLTDQGKLIKRFQRKLLLVTKERDSLKEVLDSYVKEITFTGAQIEQDRIMVLERAVADHKEVIDRLESELTAAPAAPDTEDEEEEGGGGGGAVQAKKEFKKLQEEFEALRQSKEQLQMEMDRRAMRGDYNPEETRVLHFRQNPHAMATEERAKTVQMLTEENEGLRARVKLLEEGQTKDLTLLVGQRMDEGASSQEVQSLRDQLNAAGVQKQRILDAFKKTSSDFRDMCCQLTGYRIDGLPNNKQYRLTPVFAESQNDHLLFQRTPDGECLLLETPFSRTLTDLMELHLGQQRSIPVFLAALVMDLFSKRTFDTMDTVEESDDEEEQEDEEEVEDDEEEEDEDDDEEEEDEEVPEQQHMQGGDEDEPICLDSD